jgi:peptide/nickel transport system permease protein/oligopeptide transport system permease protein
LLREIDLDYVRTAKSKGMTNISILFRHILKNALIPVITFLAMMLADILAGTILVEQVFNLPGLGRLLVSSISNRDYAVVQAIVLYIVSVVILINFLVDLVYQWIDPRVKRD